jgi:hypothetical protein
MARLTLIVSPWMCFRWDNSASRCAMSPLAPFGHAAMMIQEGVFDV